MGIHTHEEKYRQAVIRNISSARNTKKYLNSELKLADIKMKLGIRKEDNYYNDSILLLTGKNNKT
jgi:hypothetical protein